jgi:hypothetical protein
MKKLLLAFSIGCTLFTNALYAQDVVLGGDQSYDMIIEGRLQPAKVASCTVLMSKYVVQLHHDEHSLPPQDHAPNSLLAQDRIYIFFGGDSCDKEEGYKNIGLKFLGTTDNVMGNALANTATGSNAAQGVGVLLSDMFENAITPNSSIVRVPGASTDGTQVRGDASIPIYFTLVGLKGQDPTPGDIQTNMTVQIERL